MKTATKNAFTSDEIASVIYRYFPNETITEIIPLRGGTFNTLYQISGSGILQNGIILKTGPQQDIAMPNHERDILKTEVYVYQLLQEPKIPIPKLYGYDFSKTLLPCDYFLMEKMTGNTWYENWPIRDPGLMRALGKYTARMHNVGLDWFGELSDDQKKRFHSWGDAFTTMVEDALESIQAQHLNLPFDAIRSAVDSRWSILDAVEKPSLVNFDLWAGNVFVQKQEDGYYLTGMIDFERSFLGDPLASFSSALLLYDNVEKETAFLEGYNKASEKKLVITDADQEKMVLYKMFMYLRSYAETHRYGFWFRSLQRLATRTYLHFLLWKLRRMEEKRNRAVELICSKKGVL